MAKYSNTIEYNISTKLDAKGLSQLQTQLKEIEVSLKKMSGTDDVFKFNEPIRQIKELNKALTTSFNSSLGMLDLNKFKSELNSANVTAKGLGTAFSNSGAQGKIALTNLLGQIGKIDTGIKRTNSTVDKMFNTIGNTVRWGIISSGFSQMLNALHQSVDYVKELDDSLTQIMLVTDYSREQMNEYAKSANEAAKALGSTTTQVTQGSLVFAQQGFDLQQSSQLAEYSIKLANASQQDSTATSDQITALMNAYHLSGDMDALKRALDSWAEVANISAADVEELAKASQKAASSASTMGVSLDQMNAQIATIESVTRDAPEQIGNGLKTLYSRMTDISEGKTDEDGYDLGKVTKELNNVGIEVLDKSGQIRGVGDMIEDLMAVWQDLDDTAKQASAQAIAGKYQLNRFYALMENTDLYEQYKQGSMNAEGTLDQMNEEFTNSLEGRMNKLQATWEDLFNSLFDTDNVYPFIDAMTTVVGLIDKAADSIGGGIPVLTGLVSLFGRLFSNNIAQQINNTYMNRQLDQIRQQNAQNIPAILEQAGFNNPNLIQGSDEFKGIVDFIQKGQSNLSYMSKEELVQYNDILERTVNNVNSLTVEEEKFEKAITAANAAVSAAGRSDMAGQEENLIKILNDMDKNGLSQFADRFKEAKQEVASFQTAIEDASLQAGVLLEQKLNKDFNFEQQFDIMKNSLNEADNALEQLREGGIITGETFDKLEIEFSQFSNSLEDMSIEGDNAEQQIEELWRMLEQLQQALQDLSKGNIDAEGLVRLLSSGKTSIESKKGAVVNSNAEMAAFDEGMDRQKQIKSIIDTTSAIGELAFAWQAFQNLGSLWRNEDVSLGEKILQTIINLSMTIPSVVTAYQKLKETLQLLGPLEAAKIKNNIEEKANRVANIQLLIAETEAQLALNKTKQAELQQKLLYVQMSGPQNACNAEELAIKQSLAAIDGELAAQESLLITLKNGETVATEGLTVAQAGLNATMLANPITLIIAAIAALVFAIQGYISSVEEARQKNKEFYEELKNEVNTLEEQTNNFNELYKSFIETGKASDELKESAKQLSQDLGIVGADAMIAAGNFVELKKAIEDANEAKIQQLLTAAEQVQEDNVGTGFWERGYTKSALGQAYMSTGTDIHMNGNDRLRDIISKTSVSIEDSDNATKILAANEERKRLLEEYQAEWNNASLEEKHTEAWKRTNEQIQEAIRLENQFSSDERVITGTEVNNEIFSWRSKLPEFKNKFKEETDVNKILETLANDENKTVSDYFSDNNTISELQKIQKALQMITDESAKAALGVREVELGLKDQGKEVDISGTLKGIDKEDQLKIAGALDTSKTKEAIKSDLKKIVELINSGTDVEVAIKTILTPPEDANLQDVGKYTQEKIEEIFKKSDLKDVSAMDSYVKQFKENGGIGQVEGEVNTLREEIDKLTESQKRAAESLKEYEEGTPEYDRQAKAVKRLDAALKNAEDDLQQMAVEALETSNGFDELSEKWETINDALASGNSAEVAAAYTDLQGILSQLLNVDTSSITQGFMESEQTLAALKSMAEGNTDAIWDLRAAFADPLNIEAYLDTTGFDGDVEALQGYIAEAAAMLPDLEVGATIDDAPFLDALTEMCMASPEAAKIINDAFDGIGYEVHVEPAPIEMPIISAVSNIASGVAQMASNVLGSLGATESSIKFEEIGKTLINVPQLSLVKKGNPGGGKSFRKNTGGSGGKGGSGGSGKSPKGDSGGSGKTYEPKHKDPIEEEIDLYEKVNTQLDDVEETLKGIQQETDRLIGPKGRANMNQQIKLLQKEINLQKEKLKIQEKERDKLRGQLSNFNVKFDSEGFISNYADVLKGLETKYNDLIRQYNATGDEEGQEVLEHRIEKFKERIDKFKDLYKRYDELQGKEIKDTKNQIEELTNSIEDLRIEAYKAAQEAIDDLRELRDNAADLLGLFTEYKSDSPFRATIVDAEKLKNIFGGTKKEAIDYYQTIIDKNQELLSKTTDATERQTYQSYINFFKEQQQNAANNPLGTGLLGLASQDLERLQKWIDNPNASDNPFGKNTTALYEVYEDAYNRMSELAFESEKAWEQLEDDIIDGYDEIAEKEEEQIDRYDRLTDRLETIADMMGLAYGDAQYADMAKIYDQIGKSTFQQLQDQKTITEIWEKRYNEISDKTSDVAKAVQKHMEEAQDKLIEIQKEVIDAWQKAFENAMKELTAQEYKSILGVRQLDDVSSDWERDKEYASKYYDNVQKANLIEQLRLKYMDLLDNAQGSSLDTQRRIRDAMNEQVDYLEKQTYLSEYNVKYANAQLEILQKQIALEDARNNKNQMRLRRDTQGNYRYVYSANQDDVRNKEADLLQSEFDAYNMSTENRMNTYSDWLNAYQNYMDQREALLQRIEQGDQEAADALEKLEADFARDMKAYSEELANSWEGMVGALQWMTETGTDYIRDMAENAMTAIEERTEESLSEVGIQWSETVNNAIYSLSDLLSTHASITSDMMEQANKYKDLIQNQVAPTVVNSFNDINGATNQASNSTRDLAVATKELNDALASDNAALVEATKKLEDYRKQLDNVKNSSAVTARQLQQAQAELDRTKAQNLNYKSIIDNGFQVGQTVTLKKGTWLYYSRKGFDQWDNTGAKGFYLDKDTTVDIYTVHEKSNLNNPNSKDAPYPVTVFPTGQKGEPEGNNLSPAAMKRQGWHLTEDMLRKAMLDSGGYTGDWSEGITNAKNGKMAILHQKELVLNSTDTENILRAVEIIRTIADTTKIFSALGNISRGTEANKLGGDTIKQRVEITAEFPNVQDSKEIENALLSIADSAYQYSYRTR